MVAWNIDYERDSEEVIFLKKHIAEQGWGVCVPAHYSALSTHILSQPQTVATLLYMGNY
jgi:hypothetical protein